MDHNYEALADAAERGDLTPIPGTQLHGEAAAAEGRRMLMEAAGTTDLDELTRLAVGRPAVGTPSGTSPVVRARVPQVLKEQLDTYAADHGQKASEVVREALTRFLSAA